jgi:hypothetical protein
MQQDVENITENNLQFLREKSVLFDVQTCCLSAMDSHENK